MNVRTIQHPGVETREIDLTQYFAGPPTVNINNAYVMGYTDKGPIYDYVWVTSEAEFVSIYGEPTNQAERYLFYAVQSILANGGNPIVSRMPYDNKQCKTYKGLTLTYGTMGNAIGIYDDVSIASRALIDLNTVSNFIGTRIEEKGRTTQLFPRFADIKIEKYYPKGYVLWQVLSLLKAEFADIQILSNASNWMKWKINLLDKSALSEAFKGDQYSTICTWLQTNGYSYADFALLYNEIKIYFSNTAMNELTAAGFNFSVFGYEQIHKFEIENENGDTEIKNCISNGITFKYKTINEDNNKLISGCMTAFNKIFAATTPGYVKLTDQKASITSNVLETNGINNEQSRLDLTVRDLLINLCPTFEDELNIEGEMIYRGDIQNFMGFRLSNEINGIQTVYDAITDYENLNILERVEILNKCVIAKSVKYTKYYTSYNTRFTINGISPSILGISNKAITEMFKNSESGALNMQNILDQYIAILYGEENQTTWFNFYNDDKTNYSEIAKIYNDPVFYKMTNECLASVDANLLLQPEVGYTSMVGLVSKDVELTNEQYDALVTTNNFEAEPQNEVYGEKINTANYCIVDKLKTTAVGTQSNEGYFVTIIDPFDALKIQRLLVNPFENLENAFDTSSIKYWGRSSTLAWDKKYEEAINTCDTLLRVKNADGIYVGEPGAGNKTNVLDSWSLPMSAYYKNDSISKILMKNFGQIPLNSISKDGESCIDKCYSSHIVVAVCRTGVNPSDGKITVNVVESFFGSLFEQYDEATGATLYIGDLINETSNYIEFYKNEYIQPKFGGSSSKAPHNRTTVNQFFIKDSAALVNAAAQIGINVDDFDINEDFNPETEEFHFEDKTLLIKYLNEHADDYEYPPAVGRYYFIEHQSAITEEQKQNDVFGTYKDYSIRYVQWSFSSNDNILKDTDDTKSAYVTSSIKYANPADDVIKYVDVTYIEGGGNLGYNKQNPRNYYMSAVYDWKKSYGAFEELCRRGNINIFNKKKTCLYNLYQTAFFTSFSQKECEKKIANTTGIYSPVYGQSTKVASNFLQDMDYCIKFIKNVDEIPIYFVADAGISTIAQFCDNIAWDSKNEKWITQPFDPDNDIDLEDHVINSFEDCATWRRVVEKLDEISKTIRKDCMTIIDAPRQMTLDGQAPKIRPSAWKNDFDEQIGKKLRFISGLNSSYTAGYLTWFRTTDKFTGKAFWLPPTCKLIGNLVYLNAVNLPWLAPAGTMYGRVNGIHAISLNPAPAEEDQIYLKNWNYCKQYPIEGFIIEGQKTTLTKNSAFNRINVRTLFLDLERFVTNVGRNYRYKVNNQFTREQFVQTIKPKLEDYTTRGGIYEYLIKCDDNLNTPEVIDANELRAAIYIKPSRLIEFILIDFIGCKSGAVLSQITY